MLNKRTLEILNDDVVDLGNLLKKFPNAKLISDGIEIEVEEPEPLKYKYHSDYGTLTNVASYLHRVVKQNNDWIANSYGTPMDNIALKQIERLLSTELFRDALKYVIEAEIHNNGLDSQELKLQREFEESLEEFIVQKDR